MDFGMGSSFGGTSSAQAQMGPNLEEIQTEALGFLSLAGEAKVRLLRSPWPTESLPPPTSSLLSIASEKGLLAAAGPDSVIVATTEAVRKAFDGASSGGEVKPFTPQLILEIGTRISQVAFSADGSVLAISAENGGGLAVYDTQSLLQGNTKSTFELSTNGSSVRALVPNPAPELAELFAIVTVKGELMIANMKDRQFQNGPSGQVMKEGVSCVSWSTKGKQLVAGLGNGGAHQLAPDGSAKAEIPRPPNLEGDQHVSAISWLENKVFLVAHTPSSFDEGMAPSTTYHLITLQAPGNTYNFQLLPEVCSPFGLNRSPPVQFMQRLRNFPPNIQDIIIVASTSAEDVGLFTRSSHPLTSDLPAERIANQFTTTTMANDSRRAQLPMTEDMSSNTSVIGMALDLSSKSKVPRPILGDEMDESQGPLPAFLILNNEGILSGWWIVHSESVRTGTTYPGLVAAASDPKAPSSTQSQTKPAPSPFGLAAPSGPSAFGQSSFGSLGNSSMFGQAIAPKAGPFGSSTTFGHSPAAPAFGSQSSIGNRQSPWGASTPNAQTGAVAFGQPSFGSATPFGQVGKGPAFGSTGGLGSSQSPWGTPTTTPATTGNVFGQSSGSSAAKPFGLSSSATTSAFGATPNALAGPGSGFASFAGGGGFAAAASTVPKTSGDSVFKQVTPNTSFNSAMDVGSSFGASPQKNLPASNAFNAREGFKLESSWKNPDAREQNETAPKRDGPGSLFGMNFQETLEDAQENPGPPAGEAEMVSDNEQSNQSKTQNRHVVSEPITSAKNLVSGQEFLTAASGGRVLDTAAINEGSGALVRGGFSSLIPENTISTPSVSPAPAIIKQESSGDQDSSNIGATVPEQPLPPDPTSKASYTPGTSTNSSATTSKNSADEAPLPPDFLKQKSTQKIPFDSDEAPLPPDFLKQSAKPKSSPGLQDAPLPPDFVRAPAKRQSPRMAVIDDPLPPDFLPPKTDNALENAKIGDHQSSSPEEENALPEDEEENLEDEDLEDENLDEEGSGVDVAGEMSPSTDPSLKVTPESSFGQIHEKSPHNGSLVNAQQSQQTQPTKKLFGEVNKASVPFFPPPFKMQQSPRSPSPVRSALGAGMLKSDSARSVSAPGVPLRAQSTRKVTLGRPMPTNAVYPPQMSSEQRHREEREQIARQVARTQAEEEQELSDEEDEKVRAELATNVEPNLELEHFIAHQDYVGNITKTGIPGTIEKVYRDINSMIDTLGLNSRSLKGFIKGHTEMYSENGREREDLGSSEGWCLEEIDYLTTLESALEDELEEGRLGDVKGKINLCRDFKREIAKFNAKLADIRHAIDARKDPDVLEALRTAPLSAEQSIIRNDLRKEYAEFQASLAQVEDELSVLKAKLATHAKSNTNARGLAKVPTVEAVEKTILKMTSMVERKSGDIDFLETQMRRLKVNSATVSREGSPFVTPPTSARKNRSNIDTPRSNASAYGFYTPRSTRSMRSSMIDSSGAATSPSKRIGDITQDDATRYGARASRRKQIHRHLKDALICEGVRIRLLDET